MGAISLQSAVTANTTGDVIHMVPFFDKPHRSGGPKPDKLIISGITSATVKIYGGCTATNLQLLGGGTFTVNGAYDCSAFLYMRADTEDYVSHTGTGIATEVGW